MILGKRHAAGGPTFAGSSAATIFIGIMIAGCAGTSGSDLSSAPATRNPRPTVTVGSATSTLTGTVNGLLGKR